MVTFDLKEQEYIELNKVLKILHLVNSGGEANIFIENGEVKVNEVTEYRKRKKLRSGDVIDFNDYHIQII